MFRITISARSAVAGQQSTQRFISSSAAQAKAVSFFPSGKETHGAKAQSRPFRMLMLAKPGSGKGTLSARLTEKYDVAFMSTGDILRQHIKDKTEVGRTAEGIVASGGLLPDELMIKLLSSNLDTLKGKNWILDGFPRTIGQGKLLDAHLQKTASPLSLVVHLDVPDEIILARISDRWIHPSSGRIYNISYNPPKIPGLDDVTGEPLTRRPDDNPEVFGRRLKAFYKETAPLLSYYQSQASAQLVSLSGKTSDEIWPQLDGIITNVFKLKPKDARARSSVHEAVIRQVEGEIGRRPAPSGQPTSMSEKTAQDNSRASS